MLRNVYLYNKTNEISFEYIKGSSICIGETDESLESFLDWTKRDWIERGCDLSRLPKIKEAKS